MPKFIAFLLFILLLTQAASSQDSLSSGSLVSKKYLDVVSSTSGNLSKKLDKQAEKTLRQFRKQEDKLIKKLSKVDSVAAQKMMAEAKSRYKELEERMKGSALKQYIPQVDSLSTSLAFLKANPQ